MVDIKERLIEIEKLVDCVKFVLGVNLGAHLGGEGDVGICIPRHRISIYNPLPI